MPKTLHARDMVPPKRELIEQLRLETIEIPGEDVFERDAKAGVLIRVGKTAARKETRYVATGKMVERFETTDEHGKKLVHEGSMVSQDLFCQDCGSVLAPANDAPFYYLLCGRLDERDHTHLRKPVYDENGKKVSDFTDVEGDKPYVNCVLECGKAGL